MRTFFQTTLLVLCFVGAYLLWRNQRTRQVIQTYVANTRAQIQQTTVSSTLRENTQRVVDHAQQFMQNAQRVNDDETDPLERVADGLLITQRILSALGHEPTMAHLPKLNVNVEGDGVVYLRGVVHQATQRQRAEQIARATQGVKTVVNLLEIEAPTG